MCWIAWTNSTTSTLGRDYALTVGDHELLEVERNARAGTEITADDIELDLGSADE